MFSKISSRIKVIRKKQIRAERPIEKVERIILDENSLQVSIKNKLQQYQPASDKANFLGPNTCIDDLIGAEEVDRAKA